MHIRYDSATFLFEIHRKRNVNYKKTDISIGITLFMAVFPLTAEETNCGIKELVLYTNENKL